METVLITVTCISAAAAITMAVVLFLLLRRERRRSDARVMALAAMSAAEPWEPIAGAAWRDADAEPPSSSNPFSASDDSIRSDDPDLPADGGTGGVRPLFTEPETPSHWLPRAAAAGAIGILLVMAAAATSWWSRTATTPAPAAMQPTAAAPLDLLSLRHTAQEDGLTIAGVVQNPHASVQLSGVTATAFLFTQDGRLLASGRAPIDFPLLRAGDESPFVVKVAVRGNVARYRIGFRGADGRVIAHVDRRTIGALARSE